MGRAHNPSRLQRCQSPPSPRIPRRPPAPLSSRPLEAAAVELDLESHGHIYELTVLTADRPQLFAGSSGTIAAWGMNIWKAEAFANASGIIVDTFHFTDPFRTLELNPSEMDRFKTSITDVL